MDCWCEPRQESTQRGFNGVAALLCDVCFVMFCNVCFAMDVMLAILKYIFTGISAPAISIWTIENILEFLAAAAANHATAASCDIQRLYLNLSDMSWRWMVII